MKKRKDFEKRDLIVNKHMSSLKWAKELMILD